MGRAVQRSNFFCARNDDTLYLDFIAETVIFMGLAAKRGHIVSYSLSERRAGGGMVVQCVRGCPIN